MQYPKPPLPKHCFDVETGNICPCDELSVDFNDVSSYCSFYNCKLKIKENFAPIRCKRCLEKQPCSKWMTFAEIIPLLAEGRKFRKLGTSTHIYLNKSGYLMLGYNPSEHNTDESLIGFKKGDLIHKVWQEVKIEK